MAVPKKYLFFADYPAEQELIGKVVFAFFEKSFLTGSILFFVINLKAEANEYFNWLKRHISCNSCDLRLLIHGQFDVEGVVKQMDYYIAGNHPDEVIYMDSAVRNNIEIISTDTEADEIFAGISISNELTALKNNFKLAVEHMLDVYPLHRWEYFLFHEGLGESTAIFFWLKIYRQKLREHNRDRKILMLCIQPLREEMMRLCPYVDGVIRIAPPIFDYLSIYYAEIYGMRKVLTVHYSPWSLLNIKKFPVDERYMYSIPEKFRDFLGISPKIKFTTYPVNIPNTVVEKATAIFNEMGFTRDKTVFIVTEGKCYGGLQHHNNFWIKLAQTLKNIGYDVVTNGAKETIAGCKNVYLSLFESVVFTGLCGNIISIPTGFVEACCTFNVTNPVKLQMIFPNKNDIYYKRSGIMGRLSSIDNLRYFGSKFVDQSVKGYKYYLNQYISANIDFTCYQWGFTDDEDELLIKNIVDKIISND